MGMVITVKDSADFKDQLKIAGEKLVVVDFYATWCGPCKMIYPHVVEMSKTMDDVVFLKVDVDECEDIAVEYEITAMPSIIFVKKEVRVEILMGFNVQKLKDMVNKLK